MADEDGRKVDTKIGIGGGDSISWPGAIAWACTCIALCVIVYLNVRY